MSIKKYKKKKIIFMYLSYYHLKTSLFKNPIQNQKTHTLKICWYPRE